MTNRKRLGVVLLAVVLVSSAERARASSPPDARLQATRSSHVLEHLFAASLQAKVAERGSFGETSFDLVLDLGAIRDEYVRSGELRVWQTSFATFLLDLVVVQLFDIVVQSAETLGLMPSAFTGDEPAGIGRTIRYFGDHGLSAFEVSSFEWRDSNFGSPINTVHGVPHFFATSWFIARGYHPILAALAGMLNNVLFHEMIFEAWEPLSSWDVLVNSIAALTAAIPHVGNEVIWNPASGRVANRIYADATSDLRLFVSLDQLRSYANVPLAERPVVPLDVGLGLTFASAVGEIGLTYRMLTDERNSTDPLRAFDPLNRFEIMASLSIPASSL